MGERFYRLNPAIIGDNTRREMEKNKGRWRKIRRPPHKKIVENTYKLTESCFTGRGDYMAKENFMDSLSLTRRDFLKGLAAAGLLGGSLGSGWNLGQGTTEIPKWDKEADVVVVGSGGAGLSTAITAHDAGAKVVILEKLSKDQEGGNTKVSGNLWWAPTDLAKGIEHIRALSYGTLDEESIKALAEGLFKNNDWVTGLGGEIGDISKTPLGAMFAPEYPELPGADCVHAYSINGMVGMGLLWKLLRGNVDARGIEVLYETPGKELVTDDKGEVIGVIAEKGGAKKAVKAKKAVVLACGSYEFDFDMQEDFLPGWPIYCIGSPGNTGDGIKMAQKVGAAVWHMCNPMGGFPGAMMVPEYPGLPVPLVLLHIPVPSNIYVNKLGKRFMNEDLGIGRHGFGARETVLDFSIPENEHLCIPSYMIFDEAFVTSVGPLSGGLLGGWFGWHSAMNGARTTAPRSLKAG